MGFYMGLIFTRHMVQLLRTKNIQSVAKGFRHSPITFQLLSVFKQHFGNKELDLMKLKVDETGGDLLSKKKNGKRNNNRCRVREIDFATSFPGNETGYAAMTIGGGKKEHREVAHQGN
ncbi:hypothetical protein PV326_006732 [Microctonus aethiopoides]|nr:hypothetical protein PV326_006732 [Microctonus aethiopoides]